MSDQTSSASTTHHTGRQQWSGQYGFIISAIGSAVGLGNIWRFPGVAYTNGGGAFLIPYLVALITAGIPILFLDYALGHRFRGSPPLAFRRLKRRWEALGWFQVMLNFFIALYYAVVLAWAASFFIYSFGERWGSDTSQFFQESYLSMSGTGPLGKFVPAVAVPLIIVWIAAAVVMAGGVRRGIERTNTIAIPVLVLAFGVLVVRSLFLEGAADGLNAFFTPDFSALADTQVWIAAYAQIFFSLSIAFGIMLTYSSYRRRKANLTSPGLVVAFANSSFEIMAGIGVFSVLGFMAADAGIEGGIDGLAKEYQLTGPMLSFVTFPKVISEMPQGWLFGALFFGSLLLAGFTSLVSILQVICAAIQDKFNVTVSRAALGVCGVCGVLSVLLFGTAAGMTNLDIVDKWTNEVGIVASAVVMMIATMWFERRGREFAYHLSSLSTFKVGFIWRLFVSVVGPVVLGYMLVGILIDLIKTPYGGYPQSYLLIAGWGALIVSVVVSVIATVLRWHKDPDDFTPWPTFPPVAAITKEGAAL